MILPSLPLILSIPLIPSLSLIPSLPSPTSSFPPRVIRSVLQCVSMCCSVLQCDAAYCGVLQPRVMCNTPSPPLTMLQPSPHASVSRSRVLHLATQHGSPAGNNDNECISDSENASDDMSASILETHPATAPPSAVHRRVCSVRKCSVYCLRQCSVYGVRKCYTSGDTRASIRETHPPISPPSAVHRCVYNVRKCHTSDQTRASILKTHPAVAFSSAVHSCVYNVRTCHMSDDTRLHARHTRQSPLRLRCTRMCRMSQNVMYSTA